MRKLYEIINGSEEEDQEVSIHLAPWQRTRGHLIKLKYGKIRTDERKSLFLQHLYVKICIYVRKKANSILKQHPWTLRHTDGPAPHQGVCCRMENWDSFFQEGLDMFTYPWVF